MTRYEMHKKVIAHHGKDNQINKLFEELQELKDEINNGSNTVNLALEIADVMNMLEQLVIIYNLDESTVNTCQNNKMLRELGRINDDKI